MVDQPRADESPRSAGRQSSAKNAQRGQTSTGRISSHAALDNAYGRYSRAGHTAQVFYVTDRRFIVAVGPESFHYTAVAGGDRHRGIPPRFRGIDDRVFDPRQPSGLHLRISAGLPAHVRLPPAPAAPCRR